MTNYERATVRETRVVEENRVPSDPAISSTVRTTDSAYVAAGPEPAAVAARVVGFLFGVLQALLILRIVLLLLVANAGNDIVALIMNATNPFVEPFLGMFALDRVRADQGSVFDLAAVVALIGWTLIEALALAAIRIVARRPAEF